MIDVLEQIDFLKSLLSDDTPSQHTTPPLDLVVNLKLRKNQDGESDKPSTMLGCVKMVATLTR